MRPIIEYHGPLFRLLHEVVLRLGYGYSLWLWRVGGLSWLVLAGGLAISKKLPRLFTVVLVAGVVMLRLPGLGLVEQNVDESQWIVSAATLVRDFRFWQSVDGTTSGPFNVWPLTLIHYLGWELDYTTLRLWGLLTCVVPTVWLLLATLRRQYSERAARLAILPVAVCLAFATEPDAVAFNGEQLPMLLLALAGYLLTLIFYSRNQPPAATTGRLVVLGLTLGSLPYCKLQAAPTGLVLAVFAVCGLVNQPPGVSPGWVSRRFGRLSWLVVGGLLPTAGIGIYLLATGLTDYAIRSYLITNLAYAQEGSWAAGTVSWADRLQVRFPVIYGAMFSTRWFWWLTVYVLGLGLLARRSVSQPGNSARQRWLIVLVTVVSVYAVLQPGNPFMHYQWLSFVPASWLLANTLDTILTANLDSPPRRLPLLTTLTAGYLYCLLKGAVGSASMPLNPGLYQLAHRHWASPLQRVSMAIRHYARPNETMVVWGWANSLHVETGLLLGARFIPLYFPVVPGPQQDYFLEVYRQDLLTNRPTVLVDAVDVHVIGDYRPYPIRRYPGIQTILDQRYQLMATVDGAKIYVLRR